MSVGSHLQIRLDEYDARIRTFIPGYEQMLEFAANSLRALDYTFTPHIVDLGTGTGALAACCIRTLPGASVTAIDEDSAILDMARQRLGAHGALASFVQSSFLDVALPSCDAIVASLALHHVRTTDRKRQLYRDCHAALAPGGLFISADCYPSADPALAAIERDAWRAHMRRTYSDDEITGYFAAWAQEDVYVPLALECQMLRDAGLLPDVIWRQGPFAVLVARRV
jgi:SAM-dependent methyltransferase